ncbi:reproductive homeobox 10 [Rattus norvegicus]|uniref:Reproductive homeobox 10 n=1 Tax=Rattus norvegicus TaxID=10116 RepID=Q4TU73_RAT|nr:reproductive homeobox 10 [Rattus norvegicus]AAY58268.1 reproductive homeobox on X chromosome 10 [Rattus norvegicus]|eukprot:NP_001032670.1 Rhox homeobox family member 10 [Rattus norvegicus]
MESKYFYFDLDYYGVSFYEEEIMTDSQQRVAAAAVRCRFGRGVRVLHELGQDEHLSFKYKQNYSYETRKETQARPSEPEKAAGTAACRSNNRQIKHHKFTYAQLCELEKAFQETQYPDAHRRKALAALIHVDECKVKAWFKNKRAKYRKKHKELLLSSATSGTLNNFSAQMNEDPKSSTSVPEEPIGFIVCQQHLGKSCWS